MKKLSEILLISMIILGISACSSKQEWNSKVGKEQNTPGVTQKLK